MYHRTNKGTPKRCRNTAVLVAKLRTAVCRLTGSVNSQLLGLLLFRLLLSVMRGKVSRIADAFLCLPICYAAVNALVGLEEGRCHTHHRGQAPTPAVTYV